MTLMSLQGECFNRRPGSEGLILPTGDAGAGKEGVLISVGQTESGQKLLGLCLCVKMGHKVHTQNLKFGVSSIQRMEAGSEKEHRMPNRRGNDIREIETLTRAVELVLRKLISFLVGRLSLVKLQEMIRFIYVEEAEDQLKSESLSKNVPLTTLALVTGLDTRTLTRTRNHESYRRPFHRKSSFLREFTPAAAILDTWTSNANFLDPITKLPKTLRLNGEDDSFEQLFSTTIKSRGVTQQSVLDRLVLNGAIQVNEDEGTVELVNQSYLPFRSADQLGSFEVGYAAAANLLETIVHNFETDTHGDKFFQRGVWTHRLAPQKRINLKSALTKILEDTEKEGREVLSALEEDYESPSQITAGISLFYFEDRSE